MGATVWVRLSALAHGRSGDKGDGANIGLVAHRREWLELLEAAITPERVTAWLGDMLEGRVEVFSLPGIGAVNVLCHQVLQGGGTVALRLDAQGKLLGQQVLRARVPVDRDRAAALEVPLDDATEDEAGTLPHGP